MGAHSRNKGQRVEREMVKILQDKGFGAEKVSRMYGPDEDISVPFLGADRIIEVKARKDGFKQIYDWKGDKFALIIKANHKRPLLIIDLDEAAAIGWLAESSKSNLKEESNGTQAKDHNSGSKAIRDTGGESSDPWPRRDW